jgi:hypothetical protein
MFFTMTSAAAFLAAGFVMTFCQITPPIPGTPAPAWGAIVLSTSIVSILGITVTAGSMILPPSPTTAGLTITPPCRSKIRK